MYLLQYDLEHDSVRLVGQRRGNQSNLMNNDLSKWLFLEQSG